MAKNLNQQLMAHKYIVRKRQNKILYTEFLLLAGLIAFLSVSYYKIHPAIGLLIGIAAIFLFAVLFFKVKIFRYIFSVLFSLGWAAGAFMAGESIDKSSDATAWVFAVIAFALSIWAHWDHFTFLKDAKVYEYERQ